MPAALELVSVSKSFGAVAALRDVSLTIERGEIFALVGENGAGKTTLMNVAFGLYKPDAGRVRAFEKDAPIRSPADAIALGVGMVHQHFMLVPPMTVAENVVLGREPTRRGLLDRDEAERRVREVAQRFGFELDPRARVEQLGVGAQQRVEIVKALYRGAELLILDEPTANLTPQEAEDLYRVVRELAKAGKTVIFITHKLKEVLAVATRIGVMRRGKLVSVVKPPETSLAHLAELMVGGELARLEAPRKTKPAPTSPAEPNRTPAPILDVVGLSASNDRGRPALTDLSFSLYEGEILAVAGVDGNGQAELAEVLTGLRAPDAGHLWFRYGLSPQAVPQVRDLAGATPGAVRAAGLSHVPADRQRRGLCLSMSVEENLALGRQARPPFARGPLIDGAGRLGAARRLCAEFDVRPPDPALPARALSGGNQQKVILAREIDSDPRILIAVQPTRGLDVGAIAAVHARLCRARDQGRAVLLVSLDLDEVLALADRVLVLYGGRSMGIIHPTPTDEQRLGRMMLGHPDRDPVVALA